MEQSSGLNWQRDDFANITEPFENDLLNRKPLAEHLTRYIDRLQVGAVLALDARWGEGKTWFVMHWQKYLEQTESPHKVIYINAFAQDHIDDPFLLIAAELRAIIAQDLSAQKRFTEKVMQVGKVLAPAAYKAAVSTSVKWAMGINDGSDKLEKLQEQLIDAASEQVGLWVENQIKEHENNKNAFANFKTVLKELAAKHEQPIVIIIDELDRCNPLFSVRLIERIKHFFDIPNIVFVLVCDKHQLQKTICHQFGYDENLGEAYLDKFIDFSINLERPMNDNRNKEFLLVISDTMFKLGFTEKEIDDYKYAILIFATIHSNSIRQIIKNINRFSLLQVKDNNKDIVLLYKLFNPIIDNQLPLFMYMLYDFIRHFDKQTVTLTNSNQLEKYISEVVFTFDEKIKDYRFSNNVHSIENQIRHTMQQDLGLFFNKLSIITYRFLNISKYPDGRENELLKDFCSQFSIKSYALPLELNHQWNEYIKTGLNE